MPTWVISGDSRGTAEDLPQQCRVLPTVLNEDILQGLCPVKLIEDDSSWGGGQGRRLGWEVRGCPLLNPVQWPPLLSACLGFLWFSRISWAIPALPGRFSCSPSSKSSKECLSLPLSQASVSKQG